MTCMSEWTQEQTDELVPIFNAFKEQVESLGLRTIYKTVSKTETGFTFYRICGVCKASINLRIKHSENVGTITLNQRCKFHERV